MYSIEDSGIFDDQTKDLFEFDFGIAPHAHARVSWLAGRYDSQNIDATSSFTARPDEDGENMKFLAQCCSSFLNDLVEDADTNERTASSLDSPIPIATPVPLPYSARSSEVLESMISGSKEFLAHSLTLAEKLEREHAESPHSVLKVQDEDTLSKNDSTQSVTEIQPVLPQVVSRPVQPISPSTLIALTEPYLMAWSTRLPLSPLPAQVLRSPVIAWEGARIVPVLSMLSERNSWGY